MLISQPRKGENVETEFGTRNHKELNFGELSKEEQHKAIFKVLLQNFYIIETQRQTLLTIWKKIKNVHGCYGKKLKKTWRHTNHQNYLSQIKVEKDFEDFHQGNTIELEKYVEQNYCIFNAKNGGVITFFKHNDNSCVPKMLEKFI